MLRNTLGQDLCLAAFVCGVAGIALWGTAGLPQPRWEPLGPASLPRTIAYGLLALSVVLVIRSVIGRGSQREVDQLIEASDGPVPDGTAYVGRTIVFMSLCVLGVLGMSLGWSTYRPIAFIVAVAGSFILNGYKLPPIVPTLVLGLVMSVGVHSFMTQLLGVPLR